MPATNAPAPNRQPKTMLSYSRFSLLISMY